MKTVVVVDAKVAAVSTRLCLDTKRPAVYDLAWLAVVDAKVAAVLTLFFLDTKIPAV